MLDARPRLKELKHIMKYEASVTTTWYDIGLELLDDDDAVVLDQISEDCSTNVNKCCTKMFKKWLECTPDASWNQLAEAFKECGLNLAAKHITEGT